MGDLSYCISSGLQVVAGPPNVSAETRPAIRFFSPGGRRLKREVRARTCGCALAVQIIHDPILLRYIETEAGVSPRSRYGRTPETAVLRRNLPRLHSRPTKPFSSRAHHANVLTVQRRCRSCRVPQSV